MTSSIPDKFSMDDLQKLADAAPKEAEQQTNSDVNEERINEIANRHIQEALSECDTPVVHKAMIMQILCHLVDWHTKVGRRMSNEDPTEMTGTFWQRDAGKFQAMMDIMMSIHLGDEDFFTPGN